MMQDRGLNPYSNGTYSMMIESWDGKQYYPSVLILILMEHTLWSSDTMLQALNNAVLILILMEHTLWYKELFAECAPDLLS